MPEMEPLSTEAFARWWKETGERELRELLYWKWDPIGVSDSFPQAVDEYDGYAPQIVKALRIGASEDQVVELLKKIERDRMGLTGNASSLLKSTVTSLASWFEESQDRWQEFGPLNR